MDTRAQEIITRERGRRPEAVERPEKDRAAGDRRFQRGLQRKTDVGGVKTNVAKTQSDLADTVSQLMSMKGDLSEHSSLIARNHDELEILKHKGDRNYYEFTLTKGQRKPVGTVSLELKKADPKKNNFTWK